MLFWWFLANGESGIRTADFQRIAKTCNKYVIYEAKKSPGGENPRGLLALNRHPLQVTAQKIQKKEGKSKFFCFFVGFCWTYWQIVSILQLHPVNG